MEDLEWIVRTGATDKEAKVRSEVKKLWEIYKAKSPDRVAVYVPCLTRCLGTDFLTHLRYSFTAPMTPVIRRYLNVVAPGVAPTVISNPLARSVSNSRPPPTFKKPKVPAALHSSSTTTSGLTFEESDDGRDEEVEASDDEASEGEDPARSFIVPLSDTSVFDNDEEDESMDGEEVMTYFAGL